MMAKLLVLSIAFSGNLTWAGDSRDDRVVAAVELRVKASQAGFEAGKVFTGYIFAGSWREVLSSSIIDFNLQRLEFAYMASDEYQQALKQIKYEQEQIEQRQREELGRAASVKIETLMAACEVVLQESNKLLAAANQNGSWTLDALEIYQSQQAHLKQLRSQLVKEQARVVGDKE
jgi:hypothetical protein